MATSHEVGRALYRLLKGEEPPIDFEEEPPIATRHSVTRRALRKQPDGTVEMVEEEVSDERYY